MDLNTVVKKVNTLLAGERLTFSGMADHLDRTIDDINARLNSTFPAFSDVVAEGKAEYDYFPDRYIRSVVCVGAAWYYYTSDEEGISTAPQYYQDYERGLFHMVRDYFNQVPLEYQDNSDGALPIMFNEEDGERGISVNGTSIIP